MEASLSSGATILIKWSGDPWRGLIPQIAVGSFWLHLLCKMHVVQSVWRTSYSFLAAYSKRRDQMYQASLVTRLGLKHGVLWKRWATRGGVDTLVQRLAGHEHRGRQGIQLW